MKWIDLQEREPKDGQVVVLLYKPYRLTYASINPDATTRAPDVPMAETLERGMTVVKWIREGEHVGGSITHWYPLPPLTQPDPVDEPLRAGDTLE